MWLSTEIFQWAVWTSCSKARFSLKGVKSITVIMEFGQCSAAVFWGRGNAGEFKAIDWQGSSASVQPCCHPVYYSSQFGSIPALRPQFMNHGGKDTSFLLEGHYYLRLLKVSKPVPPLWRKHCCGVFRSHTVTMNNEYMILRAVFSSAWERENNGSLFFLPGCSNEGKSKLLYQSYISANIF